MESYRRDLEIKVAIGRNARLVVGNNFKVSVGVNGECPCVYGKYG